MTTEKIDETLAVTKSELMELFSHVVKGGCSSCGSSACPSCGSDKGTQGNNGQQNNQQNGQQNNNADQNTVNGGNTTSGNGLGSTPSNDPNQQSISAASMVQSMGSALKHPVQVNHDAAGLGVTHAAMLIHPEWHQGAIKDKIDGHLKAKGWKAGKGKDGGKTYDNDGHKIHVAHVGQHLIVSGQNKKGSAATPYNSPQDDKKSKNNKNISKEETILESLQSLSDSTITLIKQGF